jgi:hypothetical protein
MKQIARVHPFSYIMGVLVGIVCGVFVGYTVVQISVEVSMVPQMDYEETKFLIGKLDDVVATKEMQKTLPWPSSHCSCTETYNQAIEHIANEYMYRENIQRSTNFLDLLMKKKSLQIIELIEEAGRRHPDIMEAIQKRREIWGEP